jgi:hypothetical protein
MPGLESSTRPFLLAAVIRTPPRSGGPRRCPTPSVAGSIPVGPRPCTNLGRQASLTNESPARASYRPATLRKGNRMQRFQVMDRRTNQTVLLFASSPEDALDRAGIPARDGTVYAWQWVEGNRLEWVPLQLGAASPTSGLREHQRRRPDARAQRPRQASGT